MTRLVLGVTAMAAGFVVFMSLRLADTGSLVLNGHGVLELLAAATALAGMGTCMWWLIDEITPR